MAVCAAMPVVKVSIGLASEKYHPTKSTLLLIEEPLALIVRSLSVQASMVSVLLVVSPIPGLSAIVTLTFTLQGGSFKAFTSANQNS